MLRKEKNLENLAPPLVLLYEIKLSLARGDSIHSCLKHYFSENHDEYSNLVLKWYHLRERDVELSYQLLKSIKSPYRRALLDLIEISLIGGSIFDYIEALEREILSACHSEIKEYLDILPLKTLLPLLLFQFPAYLLLMIGPMMNSLSESLRL
ncbi:MAG: hypothetical protein KDD50_01055 [Bdellovibrionales bacterium]|nr:hypothetical protein [Bdellovibrionales bacterium]